MERTARSRYRSFVALALTWAAGFIDAHGYLLLSGVYAANMSGNTVLIGVHAVGGNWARWRSTPRRSAPSWPASSSSAPRASSWSGAASGA